MFEQIFKYPSRVKALRDAPGSQFLEGFAEELFQKEYKETTIRQYIRSAEHLTYWTNAECIPVSSLNENILERFDSHLDQCKCQRYGHSNRLSLLSYYVVHRIIAML